MSNNRGGNDQWAEKRAADEQRALTVIDPVRMPMPAQAREHHKLTETKWRALVDAVFPSAKSVAGVMLALDYCDARGLDPFKRPVHVVPMWNSKLGREVETVWPGIGELRTTASRTGLWAGNDDIVFGRMMRQAFRDERRTEARGNQQPETTTASCPEMDFPDFAQMTVYKMVGNVRVPFVGPKVFFIETFSGEKGLRVPNGRWRQAPRQMLEKCAEAAALRRAFPEELADTLTSDEMEGKVINQADIPQADYQDVDNGASGGATATGGGDQQQGNAQQQDDGWADDSQEAYVEWFANACGEVRSVKKLERAVEGEKDRIENLSSDRRLRIDEIVAETRERIANKAKSESTGSAAPADDARDRDETQEREQPRGDQQQAGQPEEPPYVRNMRRSIGACELLVDLEALSKAEAVTIDKLPAEQSRALLDAIQDRRSQLVGRK